jgi:hypothetical protein
MDDRALLRARASSGASSLRKESNPSEALQDSATPDAKQRMESTMATMNADLAQKVLQVSTSPAFFQPPL